MHVRRLACIAIIPLAALVATGCSDDSETDAKSAATTTEAGAGTSVVQMSTTTMTQAQFDAAIDSVEEALEAAGDDFCKIAAAADGLTLDAPTSPEQAQAAYEIFAKILTSVADHLPAGSTANADVLRSTAQKVLDEGKANGYDPAKFQSAPEAFTEPAAQESMMAVTEAISANCAG